MKKMIVSMMICMGAVLFTACGKKETDEDSDQRYNKNQVVEKESVTYQEFGFDLSELVDKYSKEESSASEFSSCRLLLSCETEVELDDLGAVEILKGPDGMFVLQFRDEEKAEDVWNELNEIEGVSAEPDIMISVDTTDISDSSEPISWGTTATGADAFAKQLEQTDYDPVVVAVVDSGVTKHEILGDRLLPGWDFVGNDSDASDEKGHGTHVAGIIADATSGLDIKILPIRVLNDKGRGYVSEISVGIRYAVENEVDVINLSMGGGHTNYIDEAINYAISHDIVVVVSAGNDARIIDDYCPAHIEDCITVSAIDKDFNLASFSNFGNVDFCAPGTSIYSSVPGGYAYKDGTSMAAPYISALAAMLKASGIATTVSEINDALIACSMDLGDAGWDKKYGYGLPQISDYIEVDYSHYSIRLAVSDAVCVAEHSFICGKEDSNVFSKYAIYLVDEQLHTEEAVVTLSFGLEYIDWGASDNDCYIVGHHGTTYLFDIFYDVGEWESFLYDISTDTFIRLGYASLASEDWLRDDYFLGKGMTYGVGDPTPMSINDWDGNLLYYRERVTDTEMVQDEIYFAMEESNQYVIYQMSYPDFNEKAKCTLSIGNGYLWMESDGVHYSYPDRYNEWEDGFMSFDDLHDVSVVTARNKEDLIEDLCEQIVDHYTALFNPEGHYVCVEWDFKETETDYEFVLRYAMSEKEAEERIARGAEVYANVYIAAIWIDKTTGEARDEFGWDVWYADIS